MLNRLPKPPAVGAGALLKLNALPPAALLLAAPNKLGAPAPGVSNAGVLCDVPNGLLAAGAPNRLVVPMLLAPNAGALLVDAPKAGVELAPNGEEAAGVPPKLKPPLLGGAADPNGCRKKGWRVERERGLSVVSQWVVEVGELAVAHTVPNAILSASCVPRCLVVAAQRAAVRAWLCYSFKVRVSALLESRLG